ncbi:MAG: TonB-dependent receptor [Bacteroidales bacterium]
MMHFVLSQKKALLTTSLSVVTCIGAFAQDIQVKGIIKDATGMPVMGANVVEKGTTNGVISDMDGKFQLTAKQGSTIEVSFIGYLPQEFQASTKPIVIVLQDNTVALDEAVVIGYGTVKKSDATGSVVAVKADQLNKGAVSNPMELLQGKTPGVQITTGGGAPGEGATIRIRGGASITASNDPLIVVDGLPISNTNISGMKNALATINPNDIESFTVLKDASATAIYGSRASNGVILITTKKGAAGSKGVTVNADVNFSVSYLTDKVDVLDGIGMLNAVAKTQKDGIDSPAFRALGYLDANGNRQYANTDWQDEIYRTAFSEEANVSVNGTTGELGIMNALPYRVSGGFVNQDGVLKTSNMKRGTLGFNLNPTFFDEHLRISVNGKGMYIHNRFANQDAIGAAINYDPTKPIYSDRGIRGYTAWLDEYNKPNNMATSNPIALLNDKVDKSNVKRFIGNAQFDYKFHFLPDMRANLNLGMDISKSDGSVETPVGSEMSLHDKLQLGSGLRTDYSQLRRDHTLEAYLAYNKDIKSIESKIDVMGGYSWQHFYRDERSRDVKNSNRDEELKNSLFKTESYLVSFFGRLNYTLMDKYFLTFTAREDGTSKFQNNKWGFFPSAAFAWRVINEKFMEPVSPVMSDLKLRLGYGKTGQQEIGGDYESIPTYKNHLPGSYYMFGDQVIMPVTPLGYAANLKWEETETYNIGIDYGFWNNRITGSVDAYYRKTSDLLNYVPEAAGTNLTNYITKNVGDMENKGVEASIDITAIDTKDWTWDFGFNYTWNKNKITKLTASTDPEYVGVLTGGISGGTGNTVQVQQVGQPMNSFYVYQQVYDQAGIPIEGEYVDRNADGILNDKDLYVYHKATPDVYLGFNSTLRYKKWTLSVAARAAFGNYVYDNVSSKNGMLGDLWTNNFVSNLVPSAITNGFGQGQYMSDMYVKRADYFKLDKITLAYNFTNYLRVFATGQNLITASKYKGLDPEVSNGIDNNMYPRPTTFLIGASYTF